MKKYLLFLLILAMTGCSQQVYQLIETSAINIKENNGKWVFENDTIKITYNFWEYHGILSFKVYNKLDNPIYIDWKNSSFILDEKKLDYWMESEQINTVNIYKQYSVGSSLTGPFTGVAGKAGYRTGIYSGSSEGVSSTSTTSVKPERVTFIPPKSSYSRSQFYLMPFEYFKLNFNCSLSVEKRNDNPKKSTTVLYQTFDESNSPFKFRNYIAIAFSESSNDYMFIDNSFYMSSIKEMDRRHFEGKHLGWDEEGLILIDNPYKKGTSFYLIKMVQPIGGPSNGPF